MNNSKYLADRWADVQQDKVAPFSSGISVTCFPNQSTNVDLVLTDDVFFQGLEVLLSGATFGDTVSMLVIDTNGITGVPPGTVLLAPVLNWNVETDRQKTLTYEAVVPKKALASFTIRAVYNSTSLLTPVKMAINYKMLRLLL